MLVRVNVPSPVRPAEAAFCPPPKFVAEVLMTFGVIPPDILVVLTETRQSLSDIDAPLSSEPVPEGAMMVTVLPLEVAL